MNSLPEDPVDAATHSAAAETANSAADAALFAGDTGLTRQDTRHAMVALLMGPALDARRHSKLWPVLLRDEKVIRSRLHELFLDLVMDHEMRVAFTRQVKSDDIDVPILLRRAPLTFLETALLLFLRQRLTQAEASSERAVVSMDEMREHLVVFERTDSQDHAGFAARVNAAIEKAHNKLSLLSPVGRGTGRFEVSPTLKLLFSADDIQQLTRVYTAVVTGGGLAGAGQEAPESAESTSAGDADEEPA